MSKQRGLGRGFDALIPTELDVAEAPVSTNTIAHDSIRQIDPEQITPNPHQPRTQFDEGELQSLADSIKNHGLLQPLVASDKGGGVYELIAGERRLRASKLAGLRSVPVIVRSYDEQQKMELALIENLHRVELNPIDTATAYQKLAAEFNLTLDQIGERMGKAKSTVSNAMRLLNLPKEAQDAIATGKISEAHGRALLAVNDPARRTELLSAIISQGLTVRQAEEFARGEKGARSGSGTAKLASRVGSTQGANSHIAQTLGEYLGTKVSVQPTAKGGRLTIEYYSNEELERIFETIKAD
jgi:ParB family chromosome partitioning protein